MRLTQILWQRERIFAGVSVADNCFSTKMSFYGRFGYIAYRHFRGLLVLRAAQFHQPCLFW
jgi:hypothetical protein